MYVFFGRAVRAENQQPSENWILYILDVCSNMMQNWVTSCSSYPGKVEPENIWFLYPKQ